MFIYVSSPYASVLEAFDDKKAGREFAIKIARAGCRRVLEMGHLPLSPVLSCDGVYDEETQRNLALNYSLEMLKFCQGALFVRCEFSLSSLGMILERSRAEELGKACVDFELDLKDLG